MPDPKQPDSTPAHSTLDGERSSTPSSQDQALSALSRSPEEMAELVGQLKEIAEALRGFNALTTTTQGAHFESLKRHNLGLIEGKLLPELESGLELPLFVSVIGGANTGKSTLFNALAGEILGATTVTSGATKHPLIYAHERWVDELMSGRMFPRPKMLAGPGDQFALYEAPSEESGDKAGEVNELQADQSVDFNTLVSAHARPELADVSLIDCPALDAYDQRDAQVSASIIDRADLCVFVTTPQKYKDAALIEALQRQLSASRRVFVLFNFTDDEMTHRTMAEDLKRTLPSAKLCVGGALRSERSAEPERALHLEATEALKEFLTEHDAGEVKRALLTHHIGQVVTSCQEMIGEYRDQTSRRDELMGELKRHVDSALKAYEDQLSLPFPELGEALAAQIAQLELRRIFSSSSASEQSPRWGVFFAHGFGLAGERLRSFFVKSFRFGAPPSNWEVFWRERDERDLSNLRHHAQLLRASIEQSLRVTGQDSVVAQTLLARFFNADELRRFDSSLQNAFWEMVNDEPSVGQEILKEAKAMNKRSGGFLRSGAAWIANGVKCVCGAFVAWFTFGFGLWDLLLFFPLGFIGGAYLITWLLYLRLKRRESAFKRQRVKMGRAIFETVQVKPLLGSVDASASPADVDQLATRCQQISERLDLS